MRLSIYEARLKDTTRIKSFPSLKFNPTGNSIYVNKQAREHLRLKAGQGVVFGKSIPASGESMQAQHYIGVVDKSRSDLNPFHLSENGYLSGKDLQSLDLAGEHFTVSGDTMRQPGILWYRLAPVNYQEVEQPEYHPSQKTASAL